jgi:hypothetical protein
MSKTEPQLPLQTTTEQLELVSLPPQTIINLDKIHEVNEYILLGTEKQAVSPDRKTA